MPWFPAQRRIDGEPGRRQVRARACGGSSVWRGRWLLVAWLGLGFAGPGGQRSWGHEGPEHEIEEMTAAMALGGETPDLLVGRAMEYAILGRTSEAARDLERALQLEPGASDALRELARLQAGAGRTDDAIATITRALAAGSGDPVERGGWLILRAGFLRTKGEWRRALADADAALRSHDSNPEWYLLRSDLQRSLGLHRRRIQGIEEGLKRTGAGVLGIERIEALLDAGKYRAALERIEPELEASRIRYRWLLRRGRARIGLGLDASGTQDLRDALAEIGSLPVRPRRDPQLLWEEATALALLGDRDGVQRCRRLALEAAADPGLIDRFQQLQDPRFLGRAAGRQAPSSSRR